MPWNNRMKARVLLKIRFMKANETPNEEILQKPRPSLADKRDVLAIRQVIKMAKWRREAKHIKFLKRILEEIPFFKQRKNELTKETFSKLFEKLKHSVFLPNETIIRHGEEGDRFYILISGSASVLFPNEPESESEKEEVKEERPESFRKLEEKTQGSAYRKVKEKRSSIRRKTEEVIQSNKGVLQWQKAKGRHQHKVDLEANADLKKKVQENNTSIDLGHVKTGSVSQQATKSNEKAGSLKELSFDFKEKPQSSVSLQSSGKKSTKRTASAKKSSNCFITGKRVSKQTSISELSDESTRKRKNAKRTSKENFTISLSSVKSVRKMSSMKIDTSEEEEEDEKTLKEEEEEEVSIVGHAMKKLHFENQKMEEVYGRDFYIGRKIGAGDCFGEIALLRCVPRTATILCNSRCEVLSLSKEEFQEILGENERQVLKMRIDFIQSVPIFDDWAQFCISDLLNHMVIRELPRGTKLYSEGEVADQMFIISKGEVALTKAITLSKRLYKFMEFEALYTSELFYEVSTAPLEQLSSKKIGKDLHDKVVEVRGGQLKKEGGETITKKISVCNVGEGQLAGDLEALAYLKGRGSKFKSNAVVASDWATVFVLPVFRLKRFMKEHPSLKVFKEDFKTREEWRHRRLVSIVDSLSSQEWKDNYEDFRKKMRLPRSSSFKESGNDEEETKCESLLRLPSRRIKEKLIRKEIWGNLEKSKANQAAEGESRAMAQYKEKEQRKMPRKLTRRTMIREEDENQEKSPENFLMTCPEIARSIDEENYFGVLDQKYESLKNKRAQKSNQDFFNNGYIGIETALSSQKHKTKVASNRKIEVDSKSKPKIQKAKFQKLNGVFWRRTGDEKKRSFLGAIVSTQTFLTGYQSTNEDACDPFSLLQNDILASQKALLATEEVENTALPNKESQGDLFMALDCNHKATRVLHFDEPDKFSSFQQGQNEQMDKGNMEGRKRRLTLNENRSKNSLIIDFRHSKTPQRLSDNCFKPEISHQEQNTLEKEWSNLKEHFTGPKASFNREFHGAENQKEEREKNPSRDLKIRTKPQSAIVACNPKEKPISQVTFCESGLNESLNTIKTAREYLVQSLVLGKMEEESKEKREKSKMHIMKEALDQKNMLVQIGSFVWKNRSGSSPSKTSKKSQTHAQGPRKIVFPGTTRAKFHTPLPVSQPKTELNMGKAQSKRETSVFGTDSKESTASTKKTRAETAVDTRRNGSSISSFGLFVDNTKQNRQKVFETWSGSMRSQNPFNPWKTSQTMFQVKRSTPVEAKNSPGKATAPSL